MTVQFAPKYATGEHIIIRNPLTHYSEVLKAEFINQISGLVDIIVKTGSEALAQKLAMGPA